jgi:hypothetical protein
MDRREQHIEIERAVVSAPSLVGINPLLDFGHPLAMRNDLGRDFVADSADNCGDRDAKHQDLWPHEQFKPTGRIG